MPYSGSTLFVDCYHFFSPVDKNNDKNVFSCFENMQKELCHKAAFQFLFACF